MNTNVEAVGVKLDIFKIVVAIAIVVAALAGFYYFAEQSLLYRVIGLLACIAVALVIASQTDQGRVFLSFFQDAQMEVRRVVWPTRQETLQTTGIVILMVLIFAAILWVLDLGLGAAIKSIIGQGG